MKRYPIYRNLDEKPLKLMLLESEFRIFIVSVIIGFFMCLISLIMIIPVLICLGILHYFLRKKTDKILETIETGSKRKIYIMNTKL